LGDRNSVTCKAKDFSLRHSVRTGSGTHPPPIQCVPVAVSLGDKAAGAWGWTLSYI